MKLALFSTFAFVVTQVLARPAPGCLQNYTVVVPDTCTSVAAKFNIPEEAFYTMNPGLHHNTNHDCDNLDVGKPFCVCMQAPCAMGAQTPMSTALRPLMPSNSLYPSASGVGYRPALPSNSLLHPSMGPAASSYNHPLSPPNMNNIRMSASQNPGVSNTLGVSGTATGIINAQASHPGVNSGATMETIFGTMTAMTIVISTFFSL